MFYRFFMIMNEVIVLYLRFYLICIFCSSHSGYCQPRGLSDVTDCYYGFPISLSYPHFLDSDPKLLEAVHGLKPNRSKHESHFMINPVSVEKSQNI